MQFLKIAAKVAVYAFALIGLVFTAVWVAMFFGLLNVRGSAAERNSFFATAFLAGQSCENCAWSETPEWATVHDGLLKDEAVIKRVSAETGVPARLIAAVVIPEQLRFFTSEREVYKQVFEPLKILGSMSQFSLGVSGIKQETAVQVDMRRVTTTDPTLLFNRLTDAHDHYYSYLYTALFIKEIEDEWAKAGYPITDKPHIVATLFNIGFENSHPNANPQAGGAPITVGGTTYSFGELAGLFYNSNELLVPFSK